MRPKNFQMQDFRYYLAKGRAAILMSCLFLAVSISGQNPTPKAKDTGRKITAPPLISSPRDSSISIPKEKREEPVLRSGVSKKVIVEETFLPWIDREDSLKNIARLKTKLDAIIRKYDTKRTRIGVAVYSVDRGEFIFTKDAEDLYTPASTTKLFTVMSAFYLRGDNGTIDTELYTNGYLDMDTVLIGDLFIRGQGNVYLEGDHIKTLAERVRDMGIKKVDGNIYIDNGFFDGKTDRFKYSGDADVVQKLPPIRPVILSNANLTLEVEAGPVVGDPVQYSFYPNSTVFWADNDAVVKGSRSRGSLEDAQDSSKADNLVEPRYDINEQEYGDDFDAADSWNQGEFDDLAARRRNTYTKNGVRVTQLLAKDTIQKYKITGSLPSGRSSAFHYPIKDMQRVIAGTLEYWLMSYGVEVTGGIGEKSINEYEPHRVVRLAKHGFPLVEMAMPINKKSNNFVAEQLFKFNGGNRNNSNNYAGAREVFVEMLDKLDIECNGCKLNDGSGLSRRGLLKPRAMVELLLASTQPPFTNKLRTTMAIAGVDGTIRKRMKGSPAQDNLRGKTGTLRNVSALAGFVTNEDGEEYIFAILSNGPSPYKYKRMEDEIGKLLASFYYTDADGKRKD